MADAKLKTGNRKTTVSRSEVKNVVTRSAETGKFIEKHYASGSSDLVTKKKK